MKPESVPPREDPTLAERPTTCVLACPVCGGFMLDVRAKVQCTRCHTVCETCCDGVPAQG